MSAVGELADAEQSESLVVVLGLVLTFQEYRLFRKNHRLSLAA